MGSKAKYAEEILDAIENEVRAKIYDYQNYIEPFVGGADHPDGLGIWKPVLVSTHKSSLGTVQIMSRFLLAFHVPVLGQSKLKLY